VSASFALRRRQVIALRRDKEVGRAAMSTTTAAAAANNNFIVERLQLGVTTRPGDRLTALVASD